MADHHHLYGSCYCERNQYTVVIPSSSASRAQVFFDNSAANRRSQASPITAWLRVPLDWYHSTTIAQFPDETPALIKRSFDTPTASTIPPTRRQFCGYCGSHLTAWNEQGPDEVDVTLGSLITESLARLEQAGIIRDSDDESESGLAKGGDVDEEQHMQSNERQAGGVEGGLPMGTLESEDHIRTKEGGRGGVDYLPHGGTIDKEDHMPTNERRMGGVDGPHPQRSAVNVSLPQNPAPQQQSQQRVALHRMQGRGIPYFEEMVENSRLGRIKRQKGGMTSVDGSRTVQWEVVEIGGDDEHDMGGVRTPDGSKRLKMGM